MSDAPSLSGVAVTSTGQRSSIYQDAREVSARARVTRSSEAPADQRALQRLDTLLNSGEPLNADVPRGFYINISV